MRERQDSMSAPSTPDALTGDERADLAQLEASTHPTQSGSPARAGTACFICQLDTRHCEVGALEGALLEVAERLDGQRIPSVTLRLDDGAEVTIALNEHAQPLVSALAAIPLERVRGLRLRVYHLWRAPSGRESQASYYANALSVVALEPDLLLNITDINNAEYCVRQYPLRRMVPSAPSAASLKGMVIHQAFKEMLKAGAPAVAEPLSQALRGQATELALRQLEADSLRAEAEPHMQALAQWYGSQRSSLWASAPDIRAETFLLAPEVGLKGRLDFYMRGVGGDALLELKTGQARSQLPKREHRWQVYGYQTLLTVRQPPERRKPAATLLYSGTPGQAEGYTIPFTARDLRRVLELRNQLALTHATGAVPPPPGGNKCGRCMLRPVCARASALLGWEAPPDETLAAPVDAADAAWFARMYELLRQEARAAEAEGQTLWRQTPEQRRAAGLALGDLAADGEPLQNASGEWEYTFRCDNQSELREGDAILLSDGDPINGAIVTGSILRLDDHCVTVWAPERIQRPALIDRYGSDVTHDRTVRNLWRWLDADPRLRALVAGQLAPAFDDAPSDTLDDLAGAAVVANDGDDLAGFNEEQREAVRKSLAARDFLLIQGPPGTGKTAVVAEIVRRAVARGQRVLLAAFTNQAVDNALARIVARGDLRAVRLGHDLGVAPEMRPWRLVAQARQAALAEGAADAADEAWQPTPAQLRATLLRARVVAATTATWSAERYDDVGDPLEFDLAIVDEATQLTTPSLLGALRFARRFILVGDERQLPPLVMSAEAGAAGLSRSLFADLLERWGERAGVALRRQYRMHPAICGFASETFYGGALVAAGQARTATLELRLSASEPLAPVLDPARPMALLDVAPFANERGGKVSEAQGEVARRLIEALLRGGARAERIGVIAPYRAQVAALRRKLATAGIADIVVDTVDRFQGAEREIMLVSFGGVSAATDWGGRGMEFLADPRRLNVALTRAQRKLLILGDRRELERAPLLRRLVAYCAGLYDGQGGVIALRRAAAPVNPSSEAARG
ncbi:MAG TPA: AAA domain-containing protein [Ktedonobacterales bacterium]